MLLPFASLDWELAKFFWMITNVFFVLSIPLLICRKFDIPKNLTLIIMCIFATCSPTRTVINYGQQSLFIMFFFILPFVYDNKKSYFLSKPLSANIHGPVSYTHLTLPTKRIV